MDIHVCRSLLQNFIAIYMVVFEISVLKKNDIKNQIFPFMSLYLGFSENSISIFIIPSDREHYQQLIWKQNYILLECRGTFI